MLMFNFEYLKRIFSYFEMKIVSGVFHMGMGKYKL